MKSATEIPHSAEVHSIALTEPRHVRAAAAQLYNRCFKQWQEHPTAAQARALTGLLCLTLKAIELADLVPRVERLEKVAKARGQSSGNPGGGVGGGLERQAAPARLAPGEPAQGRDPDNPGLRPAYRLEAHELQSEARHEARREAHHEANREAGNGADSRPSPNMAGPARRSREASEARTLLRTNRRPINRFGVIFLRRMVRAAREILHATGADSVWSGPGPVAALASQA
jgi:hypothetical protein